MRMRIQILTTAVTVAVTATVIGAQQIESTAELDGRAGAKNIVSVRLNLPKDVRVTEIRLTVRHGGVLVISDFIVSQCDSLPYCDYIFSLDRTEVSVILVARFDRQDSRYIFETPGDYSLTWGVYHQSAGLERIEIKQEVEILPTSQSDLDFLNRIGNLELFKRLFGADVFRESPTEFREWVLGSDGSDYRALVVLRTLVEAAAVDEPLEGKHKSLDSYLTWLNEMRILSENEINSSYSAFASFYYGAGSTTLLSEMPDLQEQNNPESRKNVPSFEDAERALQRVRGSNCRVLRLPSISQLGRIEILKGNWESAVALLASATSATDEQGPGRALIEKRLDEARRLKIRKIDPGMSAKP